MMTTFKQRLINVGLALSLVVPLHLATAQTVLAQEIPATNEVAEFLVHGEAIDTESTMYPTVSFDIVEAELPADRIVVDESTLYSDTLLFIESPGREKVFFKSLRTLRLIVIIQLGQCIISFMIMAIWKCCIQLTLRKRFLSIMMS